MNEIKILLRQSFQKRDADVKIRGFSEIYTIVVQMSGFCPVLISTSRPALLDTVMDGVRFQ